MKSSFFSPYNNNYMVKIKKKGVYNNVILQNERKQEFIHFSIYIYSLCRRAAARVIYAERLTIYHTTIHHTSIYRTSIYLKTDALFFSTVSFLKHFPSSPFPLYYTKSLTFYHFTSLPLYYIKSKRSALYHTKSLFIY